MSNVKVDKLPDQLAANTVYIVKDTAVTATDASGKVVINLQSAYYARNFQNAQTAHEVEQLLLKDLSSLKGKGQVTTVSPTPAPSPAPAPSVKLADLYKEFQQGYVDLSKRNDTENNKFFMVRFPKPFSKKPDVCLITPDVEDKTSTVRTFYMGKVTDEGFEMGLNYVVSLKGVYYYAAVTE